MKQFRKTTVMTKSKSACLPVPVMNCTMRSSFPFSYATLIDIYPFLTMQCNNMQCYITT